MKGREVTTKQEWENADHTPIFRARTRAGDGKMPAGDIILQAVVSIVFDVPEAKYLHRVSIEYRIGSQNESAIITVECILQALLRKHINKITYKGDRYDVRSAAREVVIDILANKQDWKPYSAIFTAFAEINDQDFFEQVVRGKQRKRKRAFNSVEWFCLINWHQWSEVEIFGGGSGVPPTLKFWTAEAVLGFIDYVASFRGEESKLNLPGLRSIWTRLGLTQVKPARVKDCYRSTDGSGKLKIEWDLTGT